MYYFRYRVFGLAIATSAFLNLFIPMASRLNPAAVIFVRILQGLVEVSHKNFVNLI